MVDMVPFILLFLLHIQDSYIVLRSMFLKFSFVIRRGFLAPKTFTYLHLPFYPSHELEFSLALQARIRGLIK